MARTTITRTGPFLDDEALLARVLGHVEAGTTDLAGGTWQEPVANYLSPERFERETQLLRRLPVPFCPSAALAEPGDYVARDAAGTPVVAVRGRDGTVRAFRNSCRHRGATIVAGAGRAPSLVCPYHGWTYHLDGSLRLVPHDNGFPGLEPDSRGLVALATAEHGGLVHVDQSSPATAPIDTSGLPQPLEPGQRLLETSEMELDVNWKVYVEGFLEGYHIKPTHRESFFPFGYDNLTVVETWGPHHRVTFPFRRVESLAGRPRADWSIDRMVTLVYHLFPNVIVARLSHHTTVVVVEPIAVDRRVVVSGRC
jgi:phenylpropionate dioxygenase-like ring-hydroxylating dioxygenase large terminal subunit